MNHTQNYQLSQWEMSDRIRMEDFNADNAKLDAALKAHEDAIAARATTAALSAETAARTSAVNALNAAVAKLGNCQLYCGTYTGTGKGTSMSDPRTYTFPHPPRMVVLSSGNATFWWAYGATAAINVEVRTPMVIQQTGENTVSWWCSNAGYTMDAAGTTYTIMALLDLG